MYLMHVEDENSVVFSERNLCIVINADSAGKFDGIVDMYNDNVIDDLKEYAKLTNFNTFKSMPQFHSAFKFSGLKESLEEHGGSLTLIAKNI